MSVASLRPTPFNATCTLCGALWDRINFRPPACSHTEAEWQAYKEANQFGNVWPRWNPVDPPADTAS